MWNLTANGTDFPLCLTAQNSCVIWLICTAPLALYIGKAWLRQERERKKLNVKQAKSDRYYLCPTSIFLMEDFFQLQ